MLPADLERKYAFRGKLGAGGMGTVLDAMDRIIERRVAIKVVKRPAPDDVEGQEMHARFRREVQAAGRLSHANIVVVHDYGENAETAWIVMELVEGGSLKDRLDRRERFTVQQVARLMEQVLAALAYSHARGVVHRDIKPGNIMLSAEDAGATVKIVDFGIARVENATALTKVDSLIGTPSYMAPEQFRGEPVDARADIWAAGVMLYQLLTGERPFEGGVSAVMHKALNTEPPPPSQLSVTVPRAFDAVIARALAKRPDERFPSADAFAQAIRQAAASEPPPGPRPPVWRRPMGLALGGGGLAAAAVAAWIVLQPPAAPDPPPDIDRQAEQARRAAEAARRAQEAQQAADAARRAQEAQQAADAARRAQEAQQAADAARRAREAQQAADAARRAQEAQQAADAARRAQEAQQAADAARRAQEAQQAADAARRTQEAQQAEQARQDAVRQEAGRQAEAARQAAEAARREATEAVRQAELARAPTGRSR